MVIGILSVLIGFSVLNLTTSQAKNDFSATIDTVLSDVKDQQLKAMVGDTEGRASAANYGIHFEQNKYTLFHGSSFSQGDSSNFVINLDSATQINSITFPSSNLIFSQATGEVVGFTQGQNTFVIKNTASGDQKTVTVNQYGVIIQVN